MATQILFEKSKSIESSWFEYISFLPTLEEMNLPINWPKEVIDDIWDFMPENDVEDTFIWRKNSLENFDLPSNISMASMNWILSIIQTRNCKVTLFTSWYLKSCAKNINLLVPYFDLLNHSDEAKTLFYIKDEMLCLELNYPRKKGDEVFLNYGERCPHKLLAKYGFWPDESPSNVLTILLPRKLVKSILITENQSKLILLQRVGISISGAFRIYRGNFIDDDLFLSLMILQAENDEIAAIETQLIKNSMSLHPYDEESAYSINRLIESIKSIDNEELYLKLNIKARSILLQILLSKLSELEFQLSQKIEVKDRSISNTLLTKKALETRDKFIDYQRKLILDSISNLNL